MKRDREKMEEITITIEGKYLLRSSRRNHLLSVIISVLGLLSMYIYFQHFLNDVQVLFVLLVEIALAWFFHYRAVKSREKLIALILEKFDIEMNKK